MRRVLPAHGRELSDDRGVDGRRRDLDESPTVAFGDDRSAASLGRSGTPSSDEDEDTDDEEADSPVDGRIREVREQKRYEAGRDERPSYRRSNRHISPSVPTEIVRHTL